VGSVVVTLSLEVDAPAELVPLLSGSPPVGPVGEVVASSEDCAEPFELPAVGPPVSPADSPSSAHADTLLDKAMINRRINRMRMGPRTKS
jgi:hypothetical protein